MRDESEENHDKWWGAGASPHLSLLPPYPLHYPAFWSTSIRSRSHPHREQTCCAVFNWRENGSRHGRDARRENNCFPLTPLGKVLTPLEREVGSTAGNRMDINGNNAQNSNTMLTYSSVYAKHLDWMETYLWERWRRHIAGYEGHFCCTKKKTGSVPYRTSISLLGRFLYKVL